MGGAASLAKLGDNRPCGKGDVMLCHHPANSGGIGLVGEDIKFLN